MSGAVAALVLATPASAAASPQVEAEALLVANGSTGEILLQRHASRPLPMASITKLMTALIVLAHADPDDRVTVSSRAARTGGSTIHLRAGERLPVHDLLAASLIQSANDATVALAEHVGGSIGGFVELMNERARELDLRETRFVRPDGLDRPGHVASARDLLELARLAMRKPLVRELVRRRSLSLAGGRTLLSWNDLLGRYPGLLGVKTGHTQRAGWGEVAAARRAGVTIYAVLLGAKTRAGRNADLTELLDWGFDQYRRVLLVEPGRPYASVGLPYGGQVALVAQEPAQAVVRVGRRLVERVRAPVSVSLPLRRGQALGEVVVLDGKRVVARRSLVAAESVAVSDLAGRVRWYAARALEEAGEMLDGVIGVFA